MTLEEFKKTKQHTILMLCLENAEFSEFEYNWLKKTYKIETSDYIIKWLLHDTISSEIHISIEATIKRIDCNTIRIITCEQDMSISKYLENLYYSKNYAVGKWIDSCNLDWDNIEGI